MGVIIKVRIAKNFIERMFEDYHLTDTQREKIEGFREDMKMMAYRIDNSIKSPTKNLAMNKLAEAF